MQDSKVKEFKIYKRFIEFQLEYSIFFVKKEPIRRFKKKIFNKEIDSLTEPYHSQTVII